MTYLRMLLPYLFVHRYDQAPAMCQALLWAFGNIAKQSNIPLCKLTTQWENHRFKCTQFMNLLSLFLSPWLSTASLH